MTAFGGRRYLIDMSSFARAQHPAVYGEWAEAARALQLYVSPAFRFEALYTARSADELVAIDEELAAYPSVAFDQATWTLAFAAMHDLAAVQTSFQRLPLGDFLAAAAAQQRSLGVLHYDEHFDRLASVLEFESRWLAPRGTL